MSGNPVGLVEFLLARLAEDEASANATMFVSRWSGPGHWEARPSAQTGGLSDVAVQEHPWIIASAVTAEDAAYMARFDPERALADIAAKRRIIERCRGKEWLADVPGAHALGLSLLAQDTLHALAAPFSSHPDWQPEWSIE